MRTLVFLDTSLVVDSTLANFRNGILVYDKSTNLLIGIVGQNTLGNGYTIKSISHDKNYYGTFTSITALVKDKENKQFVFKQLD